MLQEDGKRRARYSNTKGRKAVGFSLTQTEKLTTETRTALPPKTGAVLPSMAVWQLKKYNDLENANGQTRFDEARKLFTQPKRRRGVQQWHVAKNGETLKDISDAEAVKLKVLVKRTGIAAKAPLKEGQRIPLRFVPKEDGSLPWFAWGADGR